MHAIVIFGAGGRAGQAAVAEALRRGHRVTAVVRDPDRYTGPRDPRARLLAGDVTDPALVAERARGHAAAVHAAAVHGEGTDPDTFFPAAARALISGLREAAVPRLVAIGLSTLLPDADGLRPVDHGGARTGGYTILDHGEPTARISYPDFAVALLDEADTPRHHRVLVSVS